MTVPTTQWVDDCGSTVELVKAHTDEDIERGLTALAVAGNHAGRASEATGYDRTTITAWAKKHPERFREIRESQKGTLDKLAAQEYRDLTSGALSAAAEAVALERKRILNGDVKDAAASAKNLLTVAGISTDKIGVLEGRPSVIVEHRTTDGLLEEFERRFPGVVEGTAEEVEA